MQAALTNSRRDVLQSPPSKHRSRITDEFSILPGVLRGAPSIGFVSYVQMERKRAKRKAA
jgi:hypothetical protein